MEVDPGGDSRQGRSISKHGTKENKLTIRVEQPLQSCKLESYTVLLSKSANAKTQSVNSRANFSFVWHRSIRKRICCYEGCPGKKEFPGFACAKIQALIFPEEERLFCSTECISGYWNQHKKRLMRYINNKQKKKSSVGTNPAEVGDAASGSGHSHAAIQWEVVGKNKIYVPTERDVGHALKLECTAMEHGDFMAKTSCITEIVLPTPPAPPNRILQQTKVENRPHGLSRPIRICSYNILAEIYSNQTVYPYCPRWALSWNFRSRNLIRELKNFNADIFCLQEVQADRFNKFFYPEMRALGYEGLYKKKTRQSMGAEGKVDGCAIFYRTSRVNLLEKYVIEFNDAAVTMFRSGTIIAKKSGRQPSDQDAKEALERLMKDNVAQVSCVEIFEICLATLFVFFPFLFNVIITISQVVVFETLDESRQRFCVCNTHIHWYPNFRDVKLWQTHMLLKELEKFNVRQRQHLPIVVRMF